MSDELQQRIADLEAQLAALRAAATDPPPAPPKPPVSMQIDAKDSDVRDVKMINTQNYHEAPKNPVEQAAHNALRLYVQTLAGECNSLALGMLDSTDAASKGVELAHVYISLNTTTRPEPSESDEPGQRERREEPPPLSALTAVNQARCTTLLGTPGAGKIDLCQPSGLDAGPGLAGG